MKFWVQKFIVLLKNPKFYFFRLIRKIDYWIFYLFSKLITPKIFKHFFYKQNKFSDDIIIFILENIGDTIRAFPVLNSINSSKSIIICSKYNFEIINLLNNCKKFKKILVVNRDPGIIDFFKILIYFKSQIVNTALVLDYTDIQNFSIYTSKFIAIKQIYKKFNEYALKEIEDKCPNNIDILTYAKCIIGKKVLYDIDCNLKTIDLKQNNIFKMYRDYIGIHIGGMGSVVYPVSRQYPLEYSYQLIKILLKKGYKVLITGDNFDLINFKDKIDILKNYKNFKNFCGKLSIVDLAYLLNSIKIYITSDNGTLHLAQAVGCKKIYALVGPSSPLLVRGINTEIIRISLPCSPCLKFLKFPKKCSNPISHKCLKELTPEYVLKKIAL